MEDTIKPNALEKLVKCFRKEFYKLSLFPINIMEKIQTYHEDFSPEFEQHIRHSHRYRAHIMNDSNILFDLVPLHPIIYLDTDETGYTLMYRHNDGQFCCHIQTTLEQIILLENIKCVQNYYCTKKSNCPVYFYNKKLPHDVQYNYVSIMANLGGEMLPIELREFVIERKKLIFDSIIVREYMNNTCVLEIYLPTCQIITPDQLDKVIKAHNETLLSFECPACFTTETLNQRNLVYCLRCFKSTCLKCYSKIRRRHDYLFRCPFCRFCLHIDEYHALLVPYNGDYMLCVDKIAILNQTYTNTVKLLTPNSENNNL